jgi:TonB family protein
VFPDDEQQAIDCNELIHVRRHDWVRTLGDEVVRAAFWFHPGIWWLLDQLHLAREQVVDREVVEITRSRRPYLEALVKLARPPSRPALRPVALFLRRAHLPQRVALLLEEVPMSRVRLVAGLALSLAVVAAAGAATVRALPLRAAQAKPAAMGVPDASIGMQVQRPGQAAPGQQALRPGLPVRIAPPRLVHSVTPVYPPEALAAGVEGGVVLEIRVQAGGQVAEAKVLRSIPMLDQAAIDAVRQWRYEPTGAQAVITVSVRFSAAERAQAAAAAGRPPPPPRGG